MTSLVNAALRANAKATAESARFYANEVLGDPRVHEDVQRQAQADARQAEAEAVVMLHPNIEEGYSMHRPTPGRVWVCPNCGRTADYLEVRKFLEWECSV